MAGRGEAGGIAREVSAGLVGSLLALASCFSYAALIFAGPLAPHLSTGVAMALIACAATAIPVALWSGFSPVVSVPVSHTAAPLAAMTAALVPVLAGRPAGEALLLGMAALAATTFLTGAALLGLGWRRLGLLVRFVPYPVVTGFLAATGWLVLVGGLRVAVNGPLVPDALSTHVEPMAALVLGLSVPWAAALWLLAERMRHPFALPAAIVAAGVAAHLALLGLGIGPEAARAAGFLFDAGEAAPAGPLLVAEALWRADWLALLPYVGNMVAVAMMAAISVLLNSTGLEHTGRAEADLDRELKVHGGANLLSGALGGFVAHMSVSHSTFNRAAGGHGRLSGVVVGLVALAVLLGGTQFVGLVPRFLLAGLLLQLGFKLLWDWAWHSRRRLPRRDWLVVLAIVAVTAAFGFLQGVLFGLVASCIIFALDASRVGAVRHQFGLHERASPVVRSVEETRILARHGSRVRVLQLDGFIFFGSAYWLQDRVRKLIEAERPETLVFDFSACTGIDSSAAASFTRLRAHLHAAGIREVLAGVPPRMAPLLDMAGGGADLFANLDEALEACEERLLEQHAPEARAAGELASWLTEALGKRGHAEKLIARLAPAAMLDGNCLCRQGDPTETMFFIERGRVGVTIEPPGQEPLRLRVFAPHTIAGEIGFFLRAPRTATMRAEEDAVVWSLDRAAFQDLAAGEPEAAVALLTYLARLQAERLAFATRQISALQERSAP